MGIFRPNIDRLVETNDTPALMKLLTHRKPDIRLQAFMALARSRDEAVIAQLKNLLNDRDPKVRAIATLKFGDLDEPGIIENIRAIIVTGATRDQIEALRILAGRGRTEDLEISRILYMALNDKKPLVRLEAVKTMGALKDGYSVVHLLDVLEDKSYQMRQQSARALGEIGDDSTIQPLIGALVDNHPEVRKEAQEALRKIGTEKALKAITDAPFMLLVKKMTEGEFTRRETLRQIGQKKIREAVPLLKKACRDEYKNVRLEAIRSLGILRDKSSVGILSKLLEDSYHDVRLETVKALERIFDPQALVALERAMKDQNHNVRDEARIGYNSLKSRIDRASKNKNKPSGETP